MPCLIIVTSTISIALSLTAFFWMPIPVLFYWIFTWLIYDIDIKYNDIWKPLDIITEAPLISYSLHLATKGIF
jgi:hypothetical protein